MIKCLIVDDEELAIKVIETFLTPLKEFNIIGTAQSALEAYNFMSKNKVEVLFLDINMPGLSGLDFLKSIDSPPLVIITTAYREYAIDGFELDVVDYLVKPIPLPRFLHTIEKVKKRLVPQVHDNSRNLEKETPNHLLLKVDKKVVRVDLDSIYFIESLKDYIRVRTKLGNFVTHQTLTTITSLLPSNQFVRIHRSYTVSLSKVEALNGNALEINNQLIPIGRNYVTEVKELILNSGIKGS